MPSEKCWKVWIIIINIILHIALCARPRFDSSTDMGLVLIPADAEIDSVIFRLRATDQDVDFPLIFEITATVTPVVRIENLPCTLYNKVCQANVILTKRLTAGRLHDFAVRVRDSKGDSNSMQATISVTNATTQRDKIFPHIPALIMVPEDAKPGRELDYVLVRSNPWSGKPVYIELWQPKELFTIKQRQTPAQTRGIITLTGELDFETQSMYTLTIYATDPYTEPNKDTRNIAGLHLVVIVQDVQDVPPIFTLAPPLTKINNTVQPGDVILRVHAEDGDKGVPREVTYGLVSEGNPFTPFFNISESTGEIILAKPLDELTQITHVGAPVVLSIVAEEIRRSTDEPPAQATVVEVGLLLGEPGNSPPAFDNDNYVAWMDENAEPGSSVVFNEPYSTRVSDEDIGKAGVFALKLENNNGTFEISPTVAERSVKFILTVRDNSYIDYEAYKSLRFKIIAQEVGPATNLSTSVPVTVFLRDINDNPPEFQDESYEVTVSENITAGSRVIQVHATDKDTGLFGRIQYTRIIGAGSEAFVLNPVTGVVSIAMKTSILDREITPQLQLSIEARDEDGKGLRTTVPFIVKLLDVNDNSPIFEKDNYEFTLNMDLTNFSTPAIIKAFDADAEPPNNIIRYEVIHGNYDNQFFLNEETGELLLRKQITKVRNTRHNSYQKNASKFQEKNFYPNESFKNITNQEKNLTTTVDELDVKNNTKLQNETMILSRRKRDDKDILFTLTARVYDLGVPHLSTTTQINIIQNPLAGSRTVMFVVPGEHPDRLKLAKTLETITGGKITVESIQLYESGSLPNNSPNAPPTSDGVKRSIVIARVEQRSGGNSLVDIDKIRADLEANGVNVIQGDRPTDGMGSHTVKNTETSVNSNKTITTVQSEEVIVYRAENKLLYWLLMTLGLLMLLAIIALIGCCICPGCPFYMAPRKRRIHSSETIIARSDGRPRRHLHRRQHPVIEGIWSEKKQAWSADPRTYWQFNRRNANNFGIASLPGDVARIHEPRDRYQPAKAMSLRLHERMQRDNYLPMYLNDHGRRQRQHDDDRIFIEHGELQKARGYDARDIDSLHHHEFGRGSFQNIPRQVYHHDQRGSNKQLRDQHYYRDGNTEIMRLVTRDGIEETTAVTMHRHPEIIISDHPGGHRVDGKDILLRRFIEDQKLQVNNQNFHDSMHDIEQHSMDSHQRQKEAAMHQQEILLMPEKLEQFDHRQHIEEAGPDVQRLIINHGNYENIKTSVKDTQDILTSATLLIPMAGTIEKSKEQISKRSINAQSYLGHDLELARQNVLLTRILLERDGRIGGIDSASYLETQSLPGQVATGTQTDHTAATQTEPSRSRSDNEESEEDARMKRKLKSKKRYSDEPKRIRTLWMRSPIQEEDRGHGEKQRIGFRRKIKDTKDGRKILIEPEVLKEISDSLDEGGEASVTSRQFSNSQDEEVTEEKNSSPRKIEKYDKESKKIRKEEAEKNSSREEEENILEPSFRVVEKEINNLNKKFPKLTSKEKIHDSEEDSRRKELTDLNKEKIKSELHGDEKKLRNNETMKMRNSKSSQRATQSNANVTSRDRSRQRSKQRHISSISTASSELDETVEKSVRQASIKSTDSGKIKTALGKAIYPKLKRQAKVDIREKKENSSSYDSESEKQKDTSPTKSSSKIELSGKSETESDRATKKINDSVKQKKLEKPKDNGFKNRVESTSKSTKEILKKLTSSISREIIDKRKEIEALIASEEKKSSSDCLETSVVVPPKKSMMNQKVVKSPESSEDSLEYVSPMQLSRNDSPEIFEIHPDEIEKKDNITSDISKIRVDEKESDEALAMTSLHSEASFDQKVTKKVDETQDSDLQRPEIVGFIVKKAEDPLEVIEISLEEPSSVEKSDLYENEGEKIDFTQGTAKEENIENSSSEISKIKTMDSAVSVVGTLKEVIQKVHSTSSQVIDNIESIVEKGEDIVKNESTEIITKVEDSVDRIFGQKKESVTEISVEEVAKEKVEVPEKEKLLVSEKQFEQKDDLKETNQQSEKNGTEIPIDKLEVKKKPVVPTGTISLVDILSTGSEVLITEKLLPHDTPIDVSLVKSPEKMPEEMKEIDRKVSIDLPAAVEVNLLNEGSSDVDTLSVEKESNPSEAVFLNIDQALSVNSDKPGSRKNSLIIRETSFLNSPRREPAEKSNDEIKNPDEHDDLCLSVEVASDMSIPELKIQAPSPVAVAGEEQLENIVDKIKKIDTDKVPEDVGVDNIMKLVEIEPLDLTSDTIEDDSDVSSESSTKTAFIARPYGTPRHRHLIRLDQVIDDDISGLPSSYVDDSNDVGDSTVEKIEEIISIVMTDANTEKIDGEKDSVGLVENAESAVTSIIKEHDQIEEELNQEIQRNPDMPDEGKIIDEEQKKVEKISKNEQEMLPVHVDGSAYVPDEFTLAKGAEALKVLVVSRKSPASRSSTSTNSSGSSQSPISPDVAKKTSPKENGKEHAKVSDDKKKLDKSKSQKASKDRPRNIEKPVTKKLPKISRKKNEKIDGNKLPTNVPSESPITRGTNHKSSTSKPGNSMDSKNLDDRLRPWRRTEKKIQNKKLEIEKKDIKKKKITHDRGVKKKIDDKELKLKSQQKLVDDDDGGESKVGIKNDSETVGESTEKKVAMEVHDQTQDETMEVDKVPMAKYKIIKLLPKSESDRVMTLEPHEIISGREDDYAIPSTSMELQPEQIHAHQDVTEDSGLLQPQEISVHQHDRSTSPHKSSKNAREEMAEAQSRYMAWYTQNREEMERKRQEKIAIDGDDNEPPKWLRKSTRQRWLKMSPEDRRIFDLCTPEVTPLPRRKIKPLINVESEQLKAIIRQGRQLRRAEGDKNNDPSIEIYAPDKPPIPLLPPPKYHYLIQHSEYKYERIAPPPPFYLHPPTTPNSSPQLSPQQFDEQSNSFTETQNNNEDNNSTIGISIQGGSRLRHQQLLEKKSVFDIAYSEASPSHLRADSTTPPS